MMTAMHIDVCRDDALAAAFEHSYTPAYFGLPGQEVRQLIECPHPVSNL